MSCPFTNEFDSNGNYAGPRWKLYMFGSKPSKSSGNLMYTPTPFTYEPNWFVRFCTRVCFDCTWVFEK